MDLLTQLMQGDSAMQMANPMGMKQARAQKMNQGMDEMIELMKSIYGEDSPEFKIVIDQLMKTQGKANLAAHPNVAR